LGTLFVSLRRNRRLLTDLLVRDLKGRYVGSVMGFFWSIIFPAVSLLIYMLVFRLVLKARWYDKQGPFEVGLLMLVGIILTFSTLKRKRLVDKKKSIQIIHFLKVAPLFVGVILLTTMAVNPSFSLRTVLDVASGENLEGSDKAYLVGIDGKNLEDVSQFVYRNNFYSRLFSEEGFEIVIPVERAHLLAGHFQVVLRAELESNASIKTAVSGIETKNNPLFYNPYLEDFSFVGKKEGVNLYRRSDQKVLSPPDYAFRSGSLVGVEALSNTSFENPIREIAKTSKENEPTSWNTAIQSTEELQGYGLVRKGLDFSMQLEDTSFSRIEPPSLTLEVMDRTGEKKTFVQSVDWEKSKQEEGTIHWYIPSIKSGIYHFKVINQDSDFSYTIAQMEWGSKKFVLEGPLKLKSGAQLFFKNWSRTMDYSTDTNEQKYELKSIEDGIEIKEINNLPLDEVRTWQLNLQSDGFLKDSFHNFYALSIESWFNPLESIFTESITSQTEYVLIENYATLLGKDDDGNFELKRVLTGVGENSDRIIIQFKLPPDPQAWLLLKELEIEIQPL
jgi:hypothetical protein